MNRPVSNKSITNKKVKSDDKIYVNKNEILYDYTLRKVSKSVVITNAVYESRLQKIRKMGLTISSNVYELDNGLYCHGVIAISEDFNIDRLNIRGWKFYLEKKCVMEHNNPPIIKVEHNKPPIITVEHNKPPIITVEYNKPPTITVEHNKPPTITVEHNKQPTISVERDKPPTISVECDKPDTKNTSNINQYACFILKKHKQSGNFTILMNTNKGGIIQRVRYTAYRVLLPFGKEEYNNHLILNAVIDDTTNINYNLITTLKKTIKTFEELRNTDASKYSIHNKTFFSCMKEVDNTDNNIKKYQLRLHIMYGAKVTHAKRVGELSYDQLKGKICNLDIELGSMWVNNDTMMYGINIHVTHMTVLH